MLYNRAMFKRYSTKSGSFVHNNFIDFDNLKILSPIVTENFEVMQVSDSYYMVACGIAAHRQLCDVELTLVCDGTLDCYTGGERTRVSEKSCSVAFLDETHELVSAGPCRFRTLAFNVKTDSPFRAGLDALKAKFAAKTERNVFRTGLDRDFAELLSELLNGRDPAEREPFFREFTDACLKRMVIRLIRDDETATEVANALPAASDMMPEMLLYIDRRFTEIKKLTEVSDAFGYSYEYFCRVFRERYSITPHRYLLGRRMAYARERLLSGSTVTEVAQTLGYSDPYSFSRLFKSFYGHSPAKTKPRELKD